jgi:hypothetical protein
VELMSPHHPRSDDPGALPAWLTAQLQTPIDSSAASRARIMDAVRGLPTPRRRLWPVALRGASAWRRRGVLSGAGGVALTAMLVVMLSIRQGEELAWRSAVDTQLSVAGDSVVPAFGGDSLATRLGARLLDTLRVVHIALRGPQLDRAQITVDDARVQASLVRTVAETDVWQARALVPRDIVALTLVVNGVPHLATLAGR